MAALVVVRLPQIAQVGQAELAELAYQGKDLLVVLVIELLAFLLLAAVAVAQLLLEQPLVVLLEMVVLGQLHLFLAHLLAMLVAVGVDVEAGRELQRRVVVLAHQEVALLELLELQILAVVVVVAEVMAVLAVLESLLFLTLAHNAVLEEQ